jgi:hypothetical protein
MLTTSTHVGNSSSAHASEPAPNSRNAASRYPRPASQRGITAVRSEIVAVEIMNTPAIRIAKTVRSVELKSVPMAPHVGPAKGSRLIRR